MPRLNLRDDELEGEGGPLEPEKMSSPPPTLREVGGSSGHSSPLLLIIIIIVALAGGVFLLNQFKVIHLWGKRAPKVTEALPEPSLPGEENVDQGTNPVAGGEQAPPVGSDPGAVTPATTPTPEVDNPAPELKPAEQAKIKATLPPSSGGKYTVQVSAWTSKEKADEQAAKLSAAGMDAYVEGTSIDGVEWYRVRVGHYGNEKEAKEAAAQLQHSMEGVIWVARAK
jgi:cell division protein FtsN